MHQCAYYQIIKPTGLQDGISNLPGKSFLPKDQGHSRTVPLTERDAVGVRCRQEMLLTQQQSSASLRSQKYTDVIQCQTTIGVLPRSWQHFAAASLFCTRLSAFNSCKHGETASCPSCPCHLHRPSQLSPLQGPGENVSCDLIRRDEVWTLQIGFFGAGPQIWNQAFFCHVDFD